jgi:hypothetical protein
MALRYSHLAPSHKVKAVDVLDNALNAKLSRRTLASNELYKNYTIRGSRKCLKLVSY